MAVLCTWLFHPTFRAALGPLGGCIRQNLVPRPKAPQGSWVASRGCCGALALRQPLQPRRGRGLVPTPAASRSTLRTRTGGAAAVAAKCGTLLLQLPPRALSRNPPERAAPARAPDEAGVEPAAASAAGRAINRHRGLTSSAATAASAPGSLPSGHGAGEGEPGKGGVPV